MNGHVQVTPRSCSYGRSFAAPSLLADRLRKNRDDGSMRT